MERDWCSLGSFLYRAVVILSLVHQAKCFIPTQPSPCIFDQVKIESSKLQRCLLSYGHHDNGTHSETNVTLSRRKRDAEEHFHPIRIIVGFYDLDKYLNTVGIENLKRVVEGTVQRVRSLLSVIPVEGPLLLARSSDACKATVQSGINKGKCSEKRSQYTGEECLDNFKIPDDHLEGLSLWNSTSPAPVKVVYSEGAGLANTDFVLYVRSLPTQTCVGEGWNTISYAAYCQVDQKDRPVAGYINFCPTLLRSEIFEEEKVSLTALHELFHALGFASDLFGKFKDCFESGSGYECRDKHRTVAPVREAWRLVTPKVVNLTSSHFGCQTHQDVNEFGPILQTVNGIVKSHWDAAFMHGSVMTPNIGQPHTMIVDPITLAVFEDSGWYRVNYQYAETFLWGKGGGCSFGQSPSCQEDDSYFCTGSNMGCQFLHYDKGSCATDSFLHGCRVYRATPETSCVAPDNSPPPASRRVSGERYMPDSRCFLSNATVMNSGLPMLTTPLTARCFQHVCNGTDIYVRVGSSPLCYCPPQELIGIPGYLGVVQCPDAGILCNEREMQTPTTVEPMHSTIRHVIRSDPSGTICIDILYGKASLHTTQQKLILFQNCNLQTILLWTGISRRRLENFFVLPEEVVFRFDLLPMTYSDEGPHSTEVISILQDVVHNGSFTFLLFPRGPKYVATDIHQMDGGPTVVEEELSGPVIAGYAVGAVAGAIILGVLIFLAQKYHAARSQLEAARRESREQLRQQQLHMARSRSQPTTPSSRSFSNYSLARPPEPPRSIVRSEDPRSSQAYHQRPRYEMDSERQQGRPCDQAPSPTDAHVYYIPPGDGYHGNSYFPTEELGPPSYPSLAHHRLSLSSLPDGDNHSIAPVSFSSSDSDFSHTPSRSGTPLSERDLEADQNSITIVV